MRVIADRLGVAQSSVSVWVRDITAASAPAAPIADLLPGGVPTGATDRMRVKRCPRCATEKPATDFNRTGTGLTAWCRACYREYHHSRREAGRVVRRAAADRGRRHVAAALEGATCADCGLRDPVVMEFDHLGEKRANVARLLGNGTSPRRLDEEIARCEIVCVNCHRRRTARRGGHRRGLERWWEAPPPPGRATARNIAIAYAALESAGCVDCGLEDLCVLDFDHIAGKTANVIELARDGCSVDRLRAEIARCEVRCANCHRRRTAVAAGYYRSPDGPS
ncbi:hypothetical protein NBH00_01230 [Paraconexibacter antarcticus]|uniref:HNH endonuclease n=1 Tax=Paraconexibacter antarcticus TaxID=2949664 RepID=A0ABY5DW24_9ACTN|nr:hypothetical protein [Paraconexibacter antarcticus]UTI64845.1 hypothetical protein NBH00_01230 [Paraconexibacter antarcticus]